jgi:hypothetical protein
LIDALSNVKLIKKINIINIIADLSIHFARVRKNARSRIPLSQCAPLDIFVAPYSSAQDELIDI